MKSLLSFTLCLPLALTGTVLAQNTVVNGYAYPNYGGYPNYGQTVTRTTVEVPNLQPGAPGIAGTSTIIGTPSTTTRSYVTYGNQWAYPTVPYQTVPSYPYNGYTPSGYPYPSSVPLANPNRFNNPPSITVIPLGRQGYNYATPQYYAYPGYNPYPGIQYGYNNYPVNPYPNNCAVPYPVYVQPGTVITMGNIGYGSITTNSTSSSSGWGINAGRNGVSVGVSGNQNSYNSQTIIR